MTRSKGSVSLKLTLPETSEGFAEYLQECRRLNDEDLERVLGKRPGESWYRREIKQLAEDKRASEEKKDR